jgi:hypothetical protein
MPFNSLFAWIIKKRIHQIALFRQYPCEVQNELFHKLLVTAHATQWGKQHQFDRIKSYDQFKTAVPLMDYTSLQPHIDRMMSGEKNVFWPGETKWFAKSSGTTAARSKFIPVTKDSLEDCHYKGGKDLLALYYHNHPNRKLYNGKHLIIGGSAQLNPLGADAYLGDLSAIIVKNLPWWAEIRRTPAKEIALMSEWESKIERMAETTIHEDVYILAGVPSWTMVLAQKILEITGKSNLKEVWPNLELFMHGGVSFDPYRKQFESLIPDQRMNYVETYNASEGFFGIQDQVDSNEMLLMLDYGIFYEFIPMRAFKGLNSTEIYRINDVEIGENYALVISTNGGLWRYIIGDTIQFTSTRPYRFRITGRTKSFINVFGEEVIVEQAEQAIAYASEQTNAQIREFTAGPLYMNAAAGGHRWLIEFMHAPDNLEHFVELLDAELRRINSDYDAKRHKDMVLKLPTVHAVPTGTFDHWLKDKGKLGGQNKIPRLSNDTEIINEIMEIAQFDELWVN